MVVRKPVFIPVRTSAERAMFSVVKRTRQEEAAEILGRPGAVSSTGMLNPRVVSPEEARIVAQARAEAEQAGGPKPQFKVVSPGEAAFNVAKAFNRPLVSEAAVEGLPGWMQPIGREVREMTSPTMLAATALTAGVGPAVAKRLGGVALSEAQKKVIGTLAPGALTTAKLGRAAVAGALQPVVRGGFAQRMAAEQALGIGGGLAARAAVERVPETAPTAAKVAAGLAGGLVGGLGTVGLIRGLEHGIPKALVRIPQRQVQEAGLRLAGARGVAGGAEEATQRAIAKAGGVEQWRSLSPTQRQDLIREAAAEISPKPVPEAAAPAVTKPAPAISKRQPRPRGEMPPIRQKVEKPVPSRQAEVAGGVVRKEAVEDIATAPSPAAAAAEKAVPAPGRTLRARRTPPPAEGIAGGITREVRADQGRSLRLSRVAEELEDATSEELLRTARQALRAGNDDVIELIRAEFDRRGIQRPRMLGTGKQVPPPRVGASEAAPPVEAAGVVPPSPAAGPDEATARRLLVEQAQAEDRAAGITSDWKAFAKDADPSGGNPPGGKPPTGVGGDMPPPDPIDDVFERFRKQATRGEPMSEALLRRHAAAINTAENEARIFVDEATRRFQKMGLGQIRQGRLLFKQQEVSLMDNLFEALHNPSKVADGTFKVPLGLESEYQRLRALTNWEEAMRIDFDPSMATVEDYFYRGWVVPKGGVAKAVSGVPRGSLGITPSFKKPRVDATYREMRDLGFEPMSWNPYEQWRISRLQGVRYRQQMQLVDDLKKLDLAVTDASGIGVQEWRTPRVGPAFEGKIFVATDATGEPVAMYSRRWVVPSDLANRLENMYGVTPDLGNVHIGNRTIDLMKAIDIVTFVPKRAKLFGSFFQQMDFLTRSGVGAWAGMVDALVAGRPIEAARRLAVWPKSAVEIVEANLRPGAREAIRRQLNSTTPLIPGRPGIHLRGIMEAGLSTIDVTILPKDIDQMARMVATEAGLLGNKAVQRAIGSLESTMRRGLFEGVYPAAQIADIKNNVAPMIVRLYGRESDEAINGMIAKVINKKYSTIPASQSVLQNRALREGLRRLFFSIGESEGLLRQAAGAIRGPEAGYWRTHWIGAYLGLIAVASAIHLASTSEPLPWQRWLPVNKNKWGPFPVGYNPEFAAPNIPVKDTGGRQLLLDIVGQLDTAFRILDPPGFLSSRESVPVRALITQITERDYFGRAITKVGPGGIYSRTANLINDMFAPIGPGQAAVQIGLQQGRVPEGLVPSSETRLGTSGQLIQATGLNLRAQQPSTSPAIPTRTKQRIPVRKERVKERERVPVRAR